MTEVKLKNLIEQSIYMTYAYLSETHWRQLKKSFRLHQKELKMEIIV